MKKGKITKRLICLLMVLAIGFTSFMIAPTDSVWAKNKAQKRFTDLVEYWNSNDDQLNFVHIDSINEIYKHGGWYWIKGKKFKPNKKITRKQVIKTLTALYGKENTSAPKLKKPKKIAALSWLMHRIKELVI